MAMQMKLNELIAAKRGADNRLINLEDLSEQEVRALHDRYERLLEHAEHAGHLHAQLHPEKATHELANAETHPNDRAHAQSR
jgi:low affinity Fe/Cu permease